MNSIVVTDLNSKERRERIKRTQIPTRRVRDEAGKLRTVYVLEAKATNFDDQFEKLFQLNVQRARRARRRQAAIAAE